MCRRCHHECAKMCHGPGASNCTSCLHVKDGPFCVAECPTPKYNHRGVCQECHANCDGAGCDGPGSYIGPGGCRTCQRGVLDVRGNLTVSNIHYNLCVFFSCFFECVLPISRKVLCEARNYVNFDQNGQQLFI
jgi:hypothetical protein